MRRNISEFIATFALVFCGTGAVVINAEFNGVISHTGIAITFGLIVTAMIYAFGNISGAHMNPAVTLVLWADRHLTLRHTFEYLFSQVLGALTASGLLHLLFPNNNTLGATLPAGSEMQSWIMEFILTFILVLVVFRFIDPVNRKFSALAGVVIGFVVLLEAMFAGPVCGASMNPFRSLAPALVSGHLEHLWIYLTAPVAGAFGALFTDKGLRSRS